MDDIITFYNKTFFLISGGIIGNMLGVTYYTIGILNNIDKFKMENMFEKGYIFSIYTMSTIYIVYKIKDIYKFILRNL